MTLPQLVEDRAFPGAVAVASRARSRFFSEAAGRYTYDAGSPAVATDTVYDLASVTKVFVSVAVVSLVDSGEVRLEESIRRHLAELAADRDPITIRHLLTHTAGLPSVPELHRQHPDAEGLLAEMRRIPLESAPGTRVLYTSLGYQYLGWLVEAVTSTSLDRYIREAVLDPAGIVDAWFTPSATLRPRIAPTELSPVRGRVLQGEVHDENSGILGGVTGHTGLFAPAESVLRLGEHLLERVHPLLFSDLTRGLEPRRTAAFVIDDPVFGDWGRPVFSHTGFTGTSLCLVPDMGVAVALVSNRVYPTRANEQISHARTRVHERVRDLAQEAIANEH